MTGVVVLLFALAALMGVLGLVGPRRLRRRLTDRSGEPSGAVFAIGRVAAFVIAGLFAFLGSRAMGVADETSWNADEVRSVAAEAASTLGKGTSWDGEMGRLEVDEAVRDAADGIGPFWELEVKASGDDRFQLATVEDEYPFCLVVTTGRAATVEPGEC
ncbi:hypothetical protein [Streptomyces sp. NPDC046712]|uniref:hypothetical protein n=1 Tax=Streptomyces sp. NPDC046712 TaxID=3154802 RepID=UPI003408C136